MNRRKVIVSEQADEVLFDCMQQCSLGRMSRQDYDAIRRWFGRVVEDLAERFDDFGTIEQWNSDPIKGVIGRTRPREALTDRYSAEVGASLDASSQRVTVAWLTIIRTRSS